MRKKNAQRILIDYIKFAPDKCGTAMIKKGRDIANTPSVVFGPLIGCAGCCVTSTCQAKIRRLVACGGRMVLC